MARGPLPPGHWLLHRLLPAVLAITIGTASAGACPEPPQRRWCVTTRDAAPPPRWTPASAPASSSRKQPPAPATMSPSAWTSASKPGYWTAVELTKLARPATTTEGMRSQVRAMKKRNPWLRVLLQLQVPTDQLKSEERRLRASQAVTAALRKATADGVELLADWSHHGANKTHLTAFIKAVRFQLDAADAVDRRRAKRDYEIFESRTTKSMSTTTAAEGGETTEPATASTREEAEETTEPVEPATGRTAETTLTTDTVPPTATTARPVARTTRTEGSTASDAADLARQYADLEGDLGDEDDEPTRLLALQLPSKPELIAKYYDLRTMSKYVDWFAIPSQNLTDESERGYTFHHSRLMGLDDLLNTDSLVDLVTGLGAPHSQIVISLPAFALRFALQDETKNTPRSAVRGSPGILTQTELCSLISEGGWSLERDQDLTAPYAFKNGSWVAFEDHMSVSIKAKYVLLRDLAGLAIQSVDDEDWLETSCRRPAAPQQLEESDSEKKSKEDEGQIAGADGDNGDYHGDYAELETDGEKRKVVDEPLKKPDVEKKPTNETTPEAPMPFTLLETIFKSLTESSRRSRAALLSSLEDDIHQHAVQYSDYTGSVELSPYQIVRVVDREGEVHVVRKNAQTEFKCSRQGYFVHPLSCNRFYRCVKFNQLSSDYTVYEFDCPAGLAFDERYEVCVWPGSLPDGGACHGSSEIAPVPRALYGCPNNEGYYADPENCRWFFACLDHARDGLTPLTAYEFRCPFGLVFDEGRQVCNWPWLVDGCGNSGRQGVLRFHSGLYTGSSGAAAGFGAYNENEGLIEGTSLLSAGISASDLAAGNGAAGYSQGAAGYSQGAAGYSQGAAGYSQGAAGYSQGAAGYSQGSAGYSQGAAGASISGAAFNSAAAGLHSGSSIYNSAAASGLSSGSAAYNNAAYNSAAGGYSSGSSAYNSGASAFGASGIASNSLHSSDAGLGFNAAGSSQQHSSGFGSSNAGYSNLGSSLYKHTSGVSGSSLASEINANLHASSYLDQSSGTRNYGENNGYIAYSGQSQEGGSRYDDRGYGGYATFPDSHISGGRIEGSSGVVLGSNLYQGSLQGIVKESGSYGYKTGSTTNSGAYVSSQQGSDIGYQYSTGPSSSYSSGASSVSQANRQETGSLSGQIVQVASDGSSGYSGAQIQSTATPIVHSSEYSVTPTPVSVSTYQAEHVSQNVHAVTPAPAVYTFKEPVVQVQSVTPIPVTPVHQVKFQTFSPAPAVSSYRQEQYNTVQEVQPVGKLHFQAVTPTPAAVSYQEGQSHQSVSSAFGLKKFVTPAPAVVSYEVKQPEVLVQSVTPAPAVVNYQHYEVKQPIVQQKTVKFSPAVEYQHQQTYHSVTPASAIVSYQQHEVKQPEIHVQSVTPAPAVVSYQQYEVKQPDILLQPVAPAAVAYEKQQSFQSVTPVVPTYNQYEVRKPLLQVQQVSPTPGIVSFEQQQTYVSSTPKTINYKQFELKQPLVHVQSVTPAPAIVSYQSVTPSYEVKQAVTPAPAAPAIFTYKKYEVKQPVVHFQSVSPAPVTATASYGSVNFAPTAAPAIVSVAHQYKENRPLLPVQPVTAAPAVSYFRKQTPTPRPAFVTPIPAVGSYQQEQYYQSVTPASVGHSVQYSYSTPAPFSLGNVKYNRIVDIKQEPVGYYNSYNQEVQQVQQEVRPVAPAVQYQAPAVAVQYEHKQQNEHHAVQHQVQQYQQVQPVVPAVQYQTPAVSVQYEQNYQKVQHPVNHQQYYQEVQQVQPVQQDLKVEVEQTVQPIVQQVHYQQKVKPIQPVVQYRQEIKQVQPVFPAAKLEYETPKIQVQQYQQVHEIKQVQPIAKVEYQVPATQFQEIKSVQPVVQYQQQYHEAKKVQPVVEYNEQYQVKQVQPVKTVEFQKPNFSYQQEHNAYEENSGIQYNQEVHEAPVVYKQTYQQTVQPVGNYVQQQYVSPTPAVSTFRRPSVTAQEIVYKYSTPSSIPIRQEQVKQVQFSTVQYPTPAPSLSVTYKPKLYPFVTQTEGPTIVSTTPAPLQSYSSGYSSTYTADQKFKLAVPIDSSVTSVTKAPLVQSYTYSEGYVSSTPAYAEQSVTCNTCSKSTTGLRVSSTPAPVAKQQTPVAFKFQETLVSTTPKYEQGSVYVNDQRQYGVVHQVNQQAGYYGGEYDVQHNVEEEPPVALFVQTPGPGQYSQQVYSSTPAPGVGVVQQSVSHIQSERVYPERPARPIVAGYSTVTPAPQVEFVKAVQPEIKTQIVENYSSVRPEVYSQAYYTTARPAVVKTVVTQQIPVSTVEPVGFVSSAQDVEFGAKKTNVVSEYNYVQSNLAPAPTPAPVPIYSETPQAVHVEYQTTASPAVSVEDIAYTTQRVPVRRLRPTTTTAPYVEEQHQIVSEEFSSGAVPVTTSGYVTGSQQSYRGSQRYQEGDEGGVVVQQYDGNFGGKNEYSGLAQVIESSTIGAIEASSQYPSRKQNSGRVRVSSVTEGYDGYSSTDGYNEVSSTVRNKSRKRTKIVVVTRLSDVNPLLIGKLGAQCSCADANQSRRRRPGVKRVLSRVRVVRPKDATLSTEGYVSSTTEGYEALSSSARSTAANQDELEEDIALIRDAEKSDKEEDDDENDNNVGDFGIVISSTEGSSSAAYEDESASVSTSTAASRARSRSRGRTTYIRAGKAKSTIYVSTTAEPDDEVSSSSSSAVYEVTTASTRSSTARSGRRTTARSIHVNRKEENDDDKDAVVIKPRPRSGAGGHSRTDNEVATPGPGHTVDLGANGVVECKRPGLFRHPELCNKFYSCNWDSWKKKYVVNVFNCPIHLAYDTTIGACNWPSKGPACVNGKLLV